VALKLSVDAERDVSREGPLLARCRGAHVVEYVDHGLTREGQPFLALEWINGPDLEARLRQAPLSVQDTVAVGKSVAAALVTVHGACITHRDVKPGNILLPDGDCSRAKLGDLGMACVHDAGAAYVGCSQSQAALGSPHYTAPEQARAALSPGYGDVAAGRQPAVDLYALGATLFACLTGHPPHEAAHVMGLLAKLMLEAPPRLAEMRSDVPAELDALISSLLAKQPARRPASAAVVMQALQALALEAGPTAARDRSHELRERRLATMLLWQQRGEGQQAVDATVTRHGGTLQRLGSDTRAARFGGTDTSPAAVLRAAHCANQLAELLPDSRPVLATGYGEFTEASLAGDVIDCAIEMHLGRAEDDRAVLVDDSTAGLVAGRFPCQPRGPKLFALSGASEQRGEGLPMATAATARGCFGRKRELRSIAEHFELCCRQQQRRIMVVTGAPGQGKTLLCEHALAHIQHEQRDQEPARVLLARGQPDRADARFALLSQLLSSAMQLTLDRDGAQRRADILRFAAQHFADFEPSRRMQLAVFLGEILGAPFPEDTLPILKEVRRDPQAMFAQMQDAFEQTLAQLDRERPLLLMLDDLQWADSSSLRFIEGALRNLTKRAIFVLATLRPEGIRSLPESWTEPMLARLELRPLSRRACRQLIAEASPLHLDDRRTQQVIDLSAGNPLYLLEFLRFLEQGGQPDAVPGSVLALVGARLSGRADRERQLLRVASVLGERFWVGALAELLDWPHAEVWTTLDPLADAELIERRANCRFEGEVEYGFAHSLVREAAHATLLESDAPLLHLGTARWLEVHGESDAAVLAEHFRLGGFNSGASLWYGRAAEQALLANDLAGVLRHADGALGCGARGENAGRLEGLKGEALNWKGEHERAFHCAQRATALLAPGSDYWAEAIRQRVWAATYSERFSDVVLQCEQLLQHAGSSPSESFVVAAAHSVGPLNFLALGKEGRLRSAVQRWAPMHPQSHLVQGATGFMIGLTETHVETRVAAMQRAAAHYLVVGNHKMLSFCELNLFELLLHIGQYERAIRNWERACERGRRAGSDSENHYPSDLALAAWRSGRTVDLEDIERRIMSSDLAGWVRRYHTLRLAQLALEQGNCEAVLRLCATASADEANSTPAQSEATTGAGLPRGLPTVALAIKARVLLLQGRVQQGLEAAERAFADRHACETADLRDFLPGIRLAHAMALRAAGRVREARDHIGRAREVLLEEAASFSRPEFVQSFLHAIADHHLTLQLFDEWSQSPTADHGQGTGAGQVSSHASSELAPGDVNGE